jgi:hypothetical protein
MPGAVIIVSLVLGSSVTKLPLVSY